MIQLLAICNILLSVYGIIRSFKRRNLILFFWIIIAYYSITSIVAFNFEENRTITDDTIWIYVSNMTVCLTGFILCDYIFNRKKLQLFNLKVIFNNNTHYFFSILEVVFWISLVGTFIELRALDYNDYNTGTGAGWFQVIFQSSACIIVYFIYKKSWLKITIASILVLLIVAVVNVRSLLYFIIMPVLLYFLYKIIYFPGNIKKLSKKLLSIAFSLAILSVIVNYIRFGEASLPETALTSISLKSIQSTNYPLQYFNSALHYFTPFLNPIINALNIFGLNIPLPSALLLPSIPKLNAVVHMQVPDVDSLINAAHMPGNIFHDLLFSWGSWAFLGAFFFYAVALLVFRIYQSSPTIFFCFSGIFGWHYYMLLRGAVDTCSGGISYSFWVCVIMFLILKSRLKLKS